MTGFECTSHFLPREWCYGNFTKLVLNDSDVIALMDDTYCIHDVRLASSTSNLLDFTRIFLYYRRVISLGRRFSCLSVSLISLPLDILLLSMALGVDESDLCFGGLMVLLPSETCL